MGTQVVTETEPINALTLDVGHTLLFPTPSLDTIYREIGRQHKVSFPSDDFGERFEHAWEKTKRNWQGLVYGRTHNGALAFWNEVNREILPPHEFPADRLEAFVADLYEAFAHAPYWRVNSELPKLMTICREARVPVALLSNWDVRLRGLLQEFDLVAPFDVLVISAEVGVEKPFRKSFMKQCDALVPRRKEPCTWATPGRTTWREH